MIIINPNSSVPTMADFLIQYQGSYYSGTGAGLGTGYEVVTIVTEIKNKLFVQAYSVEDVGGEAKIVEVHWTISTASNGNISVIFKSPADATLYYHISGVKDKTDPTNHELSSAGAITTASPYTYLHRHDGVDSRLMYSSDLGGILDIAISAAGTSADEISVPTGATITYTRGSTGLYVITSDIDIFSTTNTTVQITLELDTGLTTTFYVAYPRIDSTKVVGVDVYAHDINTPDTTVLANAPARIFVKVVTKP